MDEIDWQDRARRAEAKARRLEAALVEIRDADTSDDDPYHSSAVGLQTTAQEALDYESRLASPKRAMSAK